MGNIPPQLNNMNGNMPMPTGRRRDTTSTNNMSMNMNMNMPPKKKRKTCKNNTIQHLILDSSSSSSTNSNTNTNTNSSTKTTSTTTIDAEDYSESSTLETVHIKQGSTITCIGENAFRDCTSLRSVHFEDGCHITSIENSAFLGCTSLQSVYIPTISNEHGEDEHKNESVNKSTMTTITIGENAFQNCTSLQSITIPQGVTTIDGCLFENCTSLQHVQLPHGLTTIGYDAFADCTALHSISIPNTVTTIEEGAFLRCQSLFCVPIPRSVGRIGGSAFLDCESLQSICLPVGVRFVNEDGEDLHLNLEKGGDDCDCDEDEDEDDGGSDNNDNDDNDNDDHPFHNCDTLEERQTNGRNYHSDTAMWLRHRFDGLPIHQACYDANNTSSPSSSPLPNHLSTIIQENKQALLTATDAMGMTPLHILCCNPQATIELIQIVVEAMTEAMEAKTSPAPSFSVLTQTDVTNSTPLELFLRSRNFVSGGGDVQEKGQGQSQESSSLLSSFPSLRDLLEQGITAHDLNILFVLNRNRDNTKDEETMTTAMTKTKIMTDLVTRDEQTGLTPFMTAASFVGCGLDVVYAFAMNHHSCTYMKDL